MIFRRNTTTIFTKKKRENCEQIIYFNFTITFGVLRYLIIINRRKVSALDGACLIGRPKILEGNEFEKKIRIPVVNFKN